MHKTQGVAVLNDIPRDEEIGGEIEFVNYFEFFFSPFPRCFVMFAVSSFQASIGELAEKFHVIFFGGGEELLIFYFFFKCKIKAAFIQNFLCVGNDCRKIGERIFNTFHRFKELGFGTEIISMKFRQQGISVDCTQDPVKVVFFFSAECHGMPNHHFGDFRF